MNASNEAVTIRLAKNVLKLLERHQIVTTEAVEICHEINLNLSHRYYEKDYVTEKEVAWLKRVDDKLLQLNHGQAFEEYHESDGN